MQVWEILILLCSTVLMLMGIGTCVLLLKYFSTIPFNHRNTVTYLTIFLISILTFGIVIIVSFMLIVEKTRFPVNRNKPWLTLDSLSWIQERYYLHTVCTVQCPKKKNFSQKYVWSTRGAPAGYILGLVGCGVGPISPTLRGPSQL